MYTGPVVPTSVMKQSYQQLREVLTTAPVLVHFNPAKLSCPVTDTSGSVMAGIILQHANNARDRVEGAGHSKGKGRTGKGNWHPVAIWLRSMAPAERNYTVSNQEMCAIVMSCCHWCHYLKGARHLVGALTDHHDLQRFMTLTALTGRQARRWETQLGNNFKIGHKACLKNLAEALS
jgi:hypothetical protein